MSGTVNVSRNIWHDTAFKKEPFTEREAFMWIIMDASYKAREKRIGNVVVQLERGQLATSVRFMCEAWDWSKSRVDRFLKRLEKRDMIGTDSGTGINVITVCKYDDYQNKPSSSGTPNRSNRDTSGTPAGHQRDKPNKGLIPDVIPDVSLFGDRSEPPAKKPAKKATQLPDDWVPSDRNIQDALSKQFSAQEIDHEADQFRDYHLARGSTFKSWDAAWRTWLGNARKFAAGRPQNQRNGASRGHIISDAVRQAGLRGFD